MNTNLTQSQSDYAVFLPAVSSFFVKNISREAAGKKVRSQRVPLNFEHGVLGLNWLSTQNSYFQYKWNLYSAGHGKLSAKHGDPTENVIVDRDKSNSWLLGDSGGFQIGKGVWRADWKNPDCKDARKKRKQVLNWMDTHMDYGMTLDVPLWLGRTPGSEEFSGVRNTREAIQATKLNNDYFIENRTGSCKFLNVLHGEDHAEAQDWYEVMKDYCDPTKYPNTHFNGWAMGGKNNGDPHLMLKRICELRWNGLLEPGVHDWMHFLGISKLEWAVMFTDIQRAIRAFHNPNFTITFDCASPFLTTRNGNIYTEIKLPHLDTWKYQVDFAADDKKYHNDTRGFQEAMIQDGILKKFESSPISDRLLIKDICVYSDTCINKRNQEPKNSWDTFSYLLQMVHNVWVHIEAVQRANRAYDTGVIPVQLMDQTLTGVTWREIVWEVMSAKSLSQALSIVDKYNDFYIQIPGVRPGTGKKVYSGKKFFRLFYPED